MRRLVVPDRYDERGLITLENGLVMLSFELCHEVRCINDVKTYLGYGLSELFFDESLFDTEKNTGGGLRKLFSNELVCLIINDKHIPSNEAIEQIIALRHDGLSYCEIEELLDDGIEQASIRQEFMESVLNKKCSIDGKLYDKDYIFFFRDKFLVKYMPHDGFSAPAKDWLTISDYYDETAAYYKDRIDLITEEINLQATCKMSLPVNIMTSQEIRNKFLYPNGVVNFIAMAVYYKTYDVALDQFLHSIHGLQPDVSNGHFEDGVYRTKAYGLLFEF